MSIYKPPKHLNHINGENFNPICFTSKEESENQIQVSDFMTPPLIDGGVAFLQSDLKLHTDPSLFFDSDNSRLGIGTNIPDASLHVVGPSKFEGHITAENITMNNLTLNGILQGFSQAFFTTNQDYNTIVPTGNLNDCSVIFEYPMVIQSKDATLNQTKSALAFTANGNNGDVPEVTLDYTRTNDGPARGKLDVNICNNISKDTVTSFQNNKVLIPKNLGLGTQSNPTVPLHVGGDSILNGVLTVTDDLKVDGKSAFTGSITCTELTADGATFINNNLTVSNGLTVNGTSTLSQDVIAQANLTVNNTSTLTGPITTNNKLTVTGINSKIALSSGRDTNMWNPITLTGNTASCTTTGNYPLYIFARSSALNECRAALAFQAFDVDTDTSIAPQASIGYTRLGNVGGGVVGKLDFSLTTGSNRENVVTMQHDRIALNKQILINGASPSLSTMTFNNAFTPKIALYSSNNVQCTGFGVSQNNDTGSMRQTLNYHVENNEAEHRFYSGGYNGVAGGNLKQLVRIYYSSFYNQPHLYIGEGTAREYQLELQKDDAGKPGISGLWKNSSDIRIKDDITDASLDRCYEIVKGIKLKRFKFKDGIYDVQSQLNGDEYGLGFIAQNVQEYFPKSVEQKPMHGLPDCLSLNADQIYKVLYGTVQKLIEKVETLEAEIQTLKNNN
jgi:cytoskeletal protein CcmA (bactofilin family)